MQNAAIPHPQLPAVIGAAHVLAKRFEIPSQMITLHRDLHRAKMPDGSALRGTKQYTLRWGTFLLVYAPAEGFFNEILGHRAATNRTLPLNPDKIRDAVQKKHGVATFDRNWGLRTRTLRGERGNRSDWEIYLGPQRVRDYLSDMKSLRDLLGHGGDPYQATNASGAFWVTKQGASMRLMGVEGFMQACTDLAAQTILAYGGQLSDVPGWPEPERSTLSAETRPPLPLLP